MITFTFGISVYFYGSTFVFLLKKKNIIYEFDLLLSIFSLWYCYLYLNTRSVYFSHLWQYLQWSLDTCFSSLLFVSIVISDNALGLADLADVRLPPKCWAHSSLRSERQFQTSSVCLCPRLDTEPPLHSSPFPVCELDELEHVCYGPWKMCYNEGTCSWNHRM